MQGNVRTSHGLMQAHNRFVELDFTVRSNIRGRGDPTYRYDSLILSSSTVQEALFYYKRVEL